MAKKTKAAKKAKTAKKHARAKKPLHKLDFSAIPTAVPVGGTISDARGEIRNILRSPLPIGSAVLITSKAGAVRAQHFHIATGYHYCFVTKGQVNYVEHDPKTGVTSYHSFGPGEMFFTPPKNPHAMFFPVDSEFWCFSGNERSHEAYEADLVRLVEPLTWPETVAAPVAEAPADNQAPANA